MYLHIEQFLLTRCSKFLSPDAILIYLFTFYFAIYGSSLILYWPLVCLWVEVICTELISTSYLAIIKYQLYLILLFIFFLILEKYALIFLNPN